MKTTISQADAAEVFDLPTEILYVCDGKKECGKPSCSDWDDRNACHHTADFSHALYDVHYINFFEQHPSVRNGAAAIICVEPIRGR